MSDYNSDSEENSSQTGEEEEESSLSEVHWVQWFCSLEGHDFLAEITLDYLKDRSNFSGIPSKIPNFEEAYTHILNGGVPDEDDLQNEKYLELYQACTDLYGLVHARFIQTLTGLTIMREKYLAGKFGVCPRVLCEKQFAIPVSVNNELRTSRVKVFCPRCQDVYYPKDRNVEIDGSYFGTSFPHVLLQEFPFLYPIQDRKVYEPTIYGFKVFKGRGVYAEKVETKYRVN